MYSNVDVSVGKRRFVFCDRHTLPNYHSLVKSGVSLPDLPYTLIKYRADPGFVTGKRLWNGFETVIRPSEPCFVQDNDYVRIATLPLLDEQVQRLIDGRRNKILKKIKGQSLPLLMLYKERHETGKLLTKFGDDMLFFLSHYKNPKAVLRHYGLGRSKWDNNANIRRLYRQTMKKPSIGDAFLQYRFAWGPLYSDISDSLKAAEVAERKGKSFHQKASMNFNFHANAIPANTAYYMSGSATVSGRFTIGYRYDITDATLAAASQIMDVETTLYDAIPYSFILDRLVNVSKYLDLRYATAGVSFSSGYESLKKTYIFTPRDRIAPLGPIVNGAPVMLAWNWGNVPPREDISFTRSILGAFNDPILEYPYKDFLDTKYLADYFFLIKQRFSRRP